MTVTQAGPREAQACDALSPGFISLSLEMEGMKQVWPFHAIQESQANEGMAETGGFVAEWQGKQDTTTLKTIKLILYLLKIMMSQQ